MLDKIFTTMTEIGDYELILLKQKGLILTFIGSKLERFKLKLDDKFEFEMDYHENTIKYNLEPFTKVLSLFRQDVIELTKSKLIGMELKRGCQYDREWIQDIEVDGKKNTVVIKSTNGKHYSANNVRVYNTETTTAPIFNFAASLLVIDNKEVCESCTLTS